MTKKILILLFILIPINANALIEVDITRGNLNPLPIAVSPLFQDNYSNTFFEKELELSLIHISEPIFSFLSIFSKPFLDTSSIDKGDTAKGSGFKFPLVISTSIKAFALIGININNKIKIFLII